MQTLRVSLCMLVSCVVSWALVSAYHVEPRTATMSGWTHRLAPGNCVSQVLAISGTQYLIHILTLIGL